MNYEIGLIFKDDENYSNKSKWCNENGCYIEEIEPDKNGERQFQIKEIIVHKKTEEQKLNELATTIRSKRNLLLAETDYLLMPDYPTSEEYLARIKKYRQELRDLTEQENFPQDVVFPDFPKIE